MRAIIFGVIVLLVSTAVVHPAQAEKHGYAQASISHRQGLLISREQPTNVNPLTKRIEQDNTRLDRLIDICPSC
jgi:hypothetical protein